MRTINIKVEEFNHQSILHYLLDKKIIVNFNCADGFCGICHSFLIEGKIIFHKEQIGFKPKGEFLLCCAKPETDISISIY